MSTGGHPDPARTLRRGPPPEEARAALVLIHGRGGTAEGMLQLAGRLETAGLALLAPQAEGGSWYPLHFLAPLPDNEPALSAALGTLGGLLSGLNAAGLPPGRVALLGFSQGACLALEYIVRHPRRYGAVFGLSGGLIGPPGTRWPSGQRPAESGLRPEGPVPVGGSLDGTPVLLGCSERDPHIPRERVLESRDVLVALGAEVTLRLVPEAGHGINEDEISAVNRRLSRLGAGPHPA